MPIHNWRNVRANRFHHFHQTWTPLIAASLNAGLLPPDYVAMAEQITGGPEPDVVTLSLPAQPGNDVGGSVKLLEMPPKVRYQTQADAFRYARKANQVRIYHPDGDVVAIIEIVSPGNKDSNHAIRSFANKALEFLQAGVHLLIVDLFPPSKRDPQGIHKVIWDYIHEEEFQLPAEQPLTLAAYTGGVLRAYVENVGVGEVLPDMPLFLTANQYIPCPLEATYQASWDVFPKSLKAELENPA